jgi:predicted AAA+ superfamily ATPase
MSHIKRHDYLVEVISALEITPVCAILGPRQCGKTTLAREVAERYKGPVFTFDLEDDRDLAKISDPFLALSDLEGLIIIDRAHLLPHLFESLRVLVDEKKNRHFLILSFAPSHLLQKTSESLAGRITYVEMMPFCLEEVGNDFNKLWSYGGFPPAYMAKTPQASYEWRRAHIKSFLERSMSGLGFRVYPQVIRRFLSLLADCHDDRFNASEIARLLNVTSKTVWAYLDMVEASFMVRRLNPWVADINKRQVKSPKIYFRDTGILHNILGIQTYEELTNHPKLESSWRCFVLEQLIRRYRADPEDCYFWETSNGLGIDLLIVKEGKRRGFILKHSGNTREKSITTAMEDLGLDLIAVVSPPFDMRFFAKSPEKRWDHFCDQVVDVGRTEYIKWTSHEGE